MNIEEFKKSEDYMPSSELEAFEDIVQLGPRVISLETCRWVRPVLVHVHGKVIKIGSVPCKNG